MFRSLSHRAHLHSLDTEHKKFVGIGQFETKEMPLGLLFTVIAQKHQNTARTRQEKKLSY